ncbi:MAG: hypothetical protein AB8B83_03000 [Bdellovibrionales bacterium]
MIEGIATQQNPDVSSKERVLTFVKNERMGGYVPKYHMQAKLAVESTQLNQDKTNAALENKNALSYQNNNTGNTAEEDFSFFDLIDMVNPLQHIPIVGHVYRELTGDEIKPISRIIGGAAYSGPVGVATALIDTVIQEETGSNITENAIQLAFGKNEQNGSQEQFIQEDRSQRPEETIETTIEQAIASAEDYDMTSALLSFSTFGKIDEKTARYEAYKRADEEISNANLEKREPITTMALSNKGGLYNL